MYAPAGGVSIGLCLCAMHNGRVRGLDPERKRVFFISGRGIWIGERVREVFFWRVGMECGIGCREEEGGIWIGIWIRMPGVPEGGRGDVLGMDVVEAGGRSALRENPDQMHITKRIFE